MLKEESKLDVKDDWSLELGNCPAKVPCISGPRDTRDSHHFFLLNT